MASKASLPSAVARYERDRSAFVNAIADAARHEGNAPTLAALGVPALLTPLLTDPADSVALTAAFALGRLAGHSRSVAASIVQAGVVRTMVDRIKEEAAAPKHEADKPPAKSGPGSPGAAAEARYGAKRAAVSVLASLARHSAGLASALADQGGLEAAIACLGEADAEVKEGAAWALAHAVAHSPDLAERACGARALPALVACLAPLPSSASYTAAAQYADTTIKRVAASALGDISGHGAELAARVVGAGALRAAATLLRQPLSNDARLKRQLLCVLMHVAKAGANLAQAVVDAGVVPDVSRCLKFADDTVRRHAAACLREIVRHSPALAAAVVDSPGEPLDSLAAYAAATASSQALPALTALGFAAEHSPELAAKVAAAPGALAALDTGLQCGDEHTQSAAAWALGRIGGHSAAAAAAVAGSVPRLCSLAATAPADSDLQTKCLRSVSAIVGQSTDVAHLAALVMQQDLAAQLLELVLGRCAAVMAKHPASRAAFASSGVIAHLEARQAQLPSDGAAAEHVAACLRLFPEELLHHYSPTYAAKLLASLGSEPPPPDAIPAGRFTADLAVADCAAEEPLAPAEELDGSGEVEGEKAQPADVAEVAEGCKTAPAQVQQDGLAEEEQQDAPAQEQQEQLDAPAEEQPRSAAEAEEGAPAPAAEPAAEAEEAPAGDVPQPAEAAQADAHDPASEQPEQAAAAEEQAAQEGGAEQAQPAEAVEEQAAVDSGAEQAQAAEAFVAEEQEAQDAGVVTAEGAAEQAEQAQPGEAVAEPLAEALAAGEAEQVAGQPDGAEQTQPVLVEAAQQDEAPAAEAGTEEQVELAAAAAPEVAEAEPETAAGPQEVAAE